jgi:hypothetical protein
MTRLKVVSTRAGSFRPHLRPASDSDFSQLARFTRISFGGGLARWRAIFRGDTHE